MIEFFIMFPLVTAAVALLSTASLAPRVKKDLAVRWGQQSKLVNGFAAAYKGTILYPSGLLKTAISVPIDAISTAIDAISVGLKWLIGGAMLVGMLTAVATALAALGWISSVIGLFAKLMHW